MNEEDEEEEALADEPMSWLSHSDGDGMPDTTDQIVKTESDLNNLNQLIAAVHPAPAVEPSVSKPTENQPTVLEPKEEEDKSSEADHEEGISDTAMPLNIASASLDYNIDAPSGNTTASDNFTVEPPLEPVNTVQPESSPELVTQLTSSELPPDHEEPNEPTPKVPELFNAELSVESQNSESSEENTATTEESPMEQTDFTQDSDTKESSSTDSSGGDSSSTTDEVPSLTSVPTDTNSKNADIPMDADVETNIDAEKAEESLADATKPDLSEPPEIVDNPTC
ncbi:unnamed protein product [Allacma fusca]|uniref:Uncharacterized protein n=1 Tax=Allacma fusca TaxID=39272 RepID=A0A8J2JVS0_9HEXA|nr:unnamed protein product [Allacma fusca]